MSKTYFCELVSGFFLNLDQTTVVIIYGRSRSIIIEKKWNFVLWLAIGLFKKVGGHITQRPIKLNKTWNFMKVGENMCQLTLTAMQSFMEIDHRWRYNSKKLSKTLYLYRKWPHIVEHVHNSHKTLLLILLIGLLILSNFASRVNAVNQIVIKY